MGEVQVVAAWVFWPPTPEVEIVVVVRRNSGLARRAFVGRLLLLLAIQLE
jgi:hypothetical protein